MKDYVVLVDEQNKPLGTMEKLAAHNADTPLHRAFSLFLFNKKGKLLLQQRSKKKKTWPGVWSNSVCGHLMLEESAIAAAKRRLSFELGINTAEMTMILPDYRYRFMKDNIVENEICPVIVGTSSEKPKPNPHEVQAITWLTWKKWLTAVTNKPTDYSPWCIEETLLLNKNKKFTAFIKNTF